jgi:arabinose-5-phosphate isomerase
VALLDARGFSKDDFARSHPRGRLPRQALLHVSDVMRKGEGVPVVAATAPLKDAVREMTRGRLGMTEVRDAAGKVSGIFTDGDLRRSLESGADFASARVADVMTAAPRVIRQEALAVGDRIIDRDLRGGVVVAAQPIQRAKLDQSLEEPSPLVLRHLVP